MKFFIIRHKSTGKIMPLMKRGRGYTHWNPNVEDDGNVHAATKFPRLFESELSAERTIIQWSINPNLHNGWRQVGPFGDTEPTLETIKDNRKKEDLEIISVYIRLGKAL